ncbi:MAG TPA: tetratricopeptide repeat protein [Balneolales bacterium]|nr:tetratricopeptide repeat protein [Balneolales bacterium]
MEPLPFELPPSLAIYAEQFEEDTDRTINKLEKHLKRRGPDAVGYFLMAWFHVQCDDMPKAIDNALKAKTYAPGSPFLEYLHYFLIHPEAFQAWVPSENNVSPVNESSVYMQPADFIHDLESLIARLTEAENKRITLDPDSTTPAEDLSVPSQSVDDIATETLAYIYEKQGKIEEAKSMYQRLIAMRPDKKKEYMKALKNLGGKSD